MERQTSDALQKFNSNTAFLQSHLAIFITADSQLGIDWENSLTLGKALCM